MLVKLTELYKPVGERAYMGEIFVRPKSVTSIRPETSALINEAYDLGIDEETSFSRLTLNEAGYSRVVVVVGSPQEVRRKLTTKQLLRG
mgnify:CR=1 FL=1